MAAWVCETKKNGIPFNIVIALFHYLSESETDRNIAIVAKILIPRLLVSISVSIEGFLESQY